MGVSLTGPVNTQRDKWGCRYIPMNEQGDQRIVLSLENGPGGPEGLCGEVSPMFIGKVVSPILLSFFSWVSKTKPNHWTNPCSYFICL